MSHSALDRPGHSRHDPETILMPYGAEETVSFTVPAKNLLAVLLPPDYPPISDLSAEVHRALAEPIGAAPLRQLVRDSKNAVIIADDNTRLTPTREIIPILLYLAIAAVIINAILLASPLHVRFIHQRNNLWPVLLYWPILLGTVFLATLYLFFIA